MGREQGVEAVVRELALQWFEANFLQQNVAVRVGENLFVNAVAAVDFGVSQFKGGDAGLERDVFESAMAFFFREEIASVSDHEPEVTGASLVDAGKIHFVDNSVTGGEPDLAVLIQGGSDAGLGAGGPARRDAGPTGGVEGIGHEVCSSAIEGKCGHGETPEPGTAQNVIDKNLTSQDVIIGMVSSLVASLAPERYGGGRYDCQHGAGAGIPFSEFNRRDFGRTVLRERRRHISISPCTLRSASILGKEKACCCKRAKFFFNRLPFIRNSSTCNRPLTRGR